MKLFDCLAIVLGFCSLTSAIAQQVSVSCDRQTSKLTILYEVEGKKPAEAGVRFHTFINFDSLISPKVCPRSGPCMIKSVGSKTLSCKMEDATFRMVFTALPSNVNLQGMCGAATTGEIEIFKNGKPFMERTEFEPGICYHPEEEYLRLVRISPNTATAELVRRQRK